VSYNFIFATSSDASHFWIAPDRRIVLLTTFHKQRQNEHREVEQAHKVLKPVQQEFDR
jgi:hypothetical protein